MYNLREGVEFYNPRGLHNLYIIKKLQIDLMWLKLKKNVYHHQPKVFWWELYTLSPLSQKPIQIVVSSTLDYLVIQFHRVELD